MTQPTRSIKELNAYIEMADNSVKGATDYSLELARRIENKNTLVSDLARGNDNNNKKLDIFYNEIRETNNELMREVIDAVQEARDLQREADGPVIDANGTVLQDADPHGLSYEVLVTALRPDSRIHSIGDEWDHAEQERRMDWNFQQNTDEDSVRRMRNCAIGDPDHTYQTPMTPESAAAVTRVINEQLRTYKQNGKCNLAQKHFADVMVANAHGVCQLNWNRAGLKTKDVPVLESAKSGHNLAVKKPSGPGLSF